MIAKRVIKNNKPYYQTFTGHTSDALILLKEYFIRKTNVLQSFCKQWDLDPILFMKDLFLAVVFHDIGKLTKQFQDNIKMGKRSQKYPHPLFGLPILMEISFEIRIENILIPPIAILGHHTQLHRSIYNSSNIASSVFYCDEYIIEFANTIVINLYKKYGFNNYFKLNKIILVNWEKNKSWQIWDNIIKPWICKDFNNKFLVKSIFSYFFSILQICDDYSSCNFASYIQNKNISETYYDSVLSEPGKYIYDHSIEIGDLKDRILGGKNLYAFQQEVIQKEKENSFIFAPCGRGKTEASLLWAYIIKKKSDRDRIVFALPTQVTCNAMYKRLIEEYGFGENNVGLFHGMSFASLKYFEKNKNEHDILSEIKDIHLIRNENFKGNIFLKPITVTTIDHLILSFAHGFPQADFALGNLLNSVIIFDEVHYYERITLEVLLKLFFYLRKMRIPHLLMTGTAPDFLLRRLTKNYTIIKDNAGLAFNPFLIEKKNEILNTDKSIKEIYDDYIKNKKVFIIVNQVKWAQNLYDELQTFFKKMKKKPIICLYHSRYIYKDRIEKEKMIKNMVKQSPCVLITTQVIEISLNISCDVMYTNVAPPDAIGQRGGRLNRSGESFKGAFLYKLKLFLAENERPYKEDIITKSWQNFKNGPATYQNIKQICDIVYNDYTLIPDTRFNDLFKANILFGDKPYEIAYGTEEGKAFKIRDNSFQTISVIPSVVYSKALDEVKNNNAQWSEYEVNIPFYLYKQEIDKNEVQNFIYVDDIKRIICHYPYDFVKGMQISTTNNNDTFI